MTAKFDAPARYRAELSDALVAYVTSHPAAVVPDPASGRSRRWIRGLPLTAAALAAAAIVVLLVGGGGGTSSLPTASPATVLRTAATALDKAGLGTPLRHGEFEYTKLLTQSRFTMYSRHPYVVTGIDRRWVAANGSGRDDFDVVKAERMTPAGPQPVR